MSWGIPEHIVEICKRLYNRNLLASADGNISYKVSDQEIWITPTGLNKGFIDIKDLALMTLEGKVIRGNPSSERLMHLEVYRSCPEAKAVVHAHPPTAIAWSVAHPEMRALPADCLSEVILAVGAIPIAPYARPGTAQMGDVLRPLIKDHRVLILARHGGISWGESLDEAYNGMERLEHIAQILKSASQLGALSPLPKEELLFLRELRKQLGPRSL